MNNLLAKIENSMQQMVLNPESDLPGLAMRFFREVVIGRSPLTLLVRKHDLEKFFRFYHRLNGNLHVTGLQPRDVKLFLNDLQAKGYRANTINRALSSIRVFGSWLIENGFVRIHPCRSIKELFVAPAPPKAPRDREFHRLRKAAGALAGATPYNYSQDFRNYALFEALSASGLRITEALSLELKQYNGKKFHDVHCKGGRVRSVSIKTETCTILDEYIAEYRTPGSDFIFTSKSGGPLDRISAWKAIKKIGRVASVGLPASEEIDLYPHQLRHRHGYKARARKDPVFAASRLGHTTLAHIQRYAGETAEEERELIESID